jgi:hypothetical protein
MNGIEVGGYSKFKDQSIRCSWNQPVVHRNYPVSTISNANNNNVMTVIDVTSLWTYLGMMKDQTNS